jgi:hypothetical protein
MESEFIAQLLDLGITGLFIGWLLWSQKEQAKRLDAYVNRLLETLATVEKEREEGYEAIRSRYDGVVERYNAERDRLLLDISAKLESIADKVDG